MNEGSSTTNEDHDKARRDSHQRTFSLTQIAIKLDRPASTVRTWKDQYNEYVESTSIGKGRNKRYTGDAVRIFSLINEMKERNEPHELIQQTLAENVDQIVYTPDDEDRPPALMNEILDSYKNIAEVIQSQESYIKRLESQLTEVSNYIRESDEKARQRELDTEQRMTTIINELSQQLEQQQKLIDGSLTKQEESAKKRDEMLMQSLRIAQENQRLAQENQSKIAAVERATKAESAERAAAVEQQGNKGLLARIFGK